MTPRKAKRTERKPPCKNAQCTQMLVDAGGEIQNVRRQRNKYLEEAQSLRTALSQAQKERDAWKQRSSLAEIDVEKLINIRAKRDIAIADLNAELREKDAAVLEERAAHIFWETQCEAAAERWKAHEATISGLREIEGKLNARVGELEAQRKTHCDFTHDLQMLMASQWDVMCGTRLINVRAISMLLEKYQ